MKYFILLIALLNTFLFSYELKLTKLDIQKIENAKNKSQIIRRFKNYSNLIKNSKNFSIFKKLNYTNLFFNKFLPTLDKNGSQIDDHWLTQKEFIFKGYGDCEDYAIAKYFTLLNLGLKKENLFLCVTKTNNYSGASFHMILLYVKNKRKSALVLDNLSSKVVLLKKRKKLHPIFAFNETSTYTLNKNKFLLKINLNWNGIKKWENILKKTYINNE